MTEPFPKGTFVRIIYDRGIQLLKAERGWIVPSSERLQLVEYPDEFEGGMGVRHIICDTEFNVPFFQPRRMFDPNGKPVSRARYLKGYVEDSHRRIYKYMVEHHLYCAVAHLGYLAEAYAGLAVLHNENRWRLPEHVRDHSLAQLNDSALRHGEAVFTSLCSALEASRFLIWRENPKPPPTLVETLELLMVSEDSAMRMLLAPLETIWHEDGVALLQYRDCCAKHHPFTQLGGRCGAFLNDADMWEMQFDVPDNPDARDRRLFRFDEGIDLLEYCWYSACRVVRCVEETLPMVYDLAIQGQEPKRWFWLSDV
jgi:hypothetical protein